MLDHYKYKHPNCLWESMHPLVRWGSAVLMVLYFGGALIAPLFWKI